MTHQLLWSAGAHGAKGLGPGLSFAYLPATLVALVSHFNNLSMCKNTGKMHFERVCKQTFPIREQAFAVPTCQWQGRAHGGLRPPVLRHKLSLGSVKVSGIKKNSSARNETDKVPKPQFVTDERQQDQTLSPERLVADTSDEDSNLPGTWSTWSTDSPLDMDEELILPQNANHYLRMILMVVVLFWTQNNVI